MSKLTKAWVEAQIEQELARGNHAEAVRDLAALLIVKKHICKDEVCTTPDPQMPTKKTDAHERKHLDKETIFAWVDNMHNDEGMSGGHYSWHQAQQYAINKGITSEQRQLEMYAIMNAMYCDYHAVAKKFGVDRPEFYACMAVAFIQDADAVDNKVQRYYECIVR